MMQYHLLTGATGLLGRYLLRDLTRADVPLAVLVRPSRWESAAQRIESLMARWEQELGRTLVRPVVLEGDISEPGLGLSEHDRAWVKNSCDTIIHSAASLTFYADDADGEPWRSNVGGVRHVLELCRQANIRRLHHVSTAYVCGKRRGQILESELDVGQELGNDYEQSKIIAEKEVLASDQFEQVTIHRPSIIVGDSQTGYTNTYHGFYTPLRLVYGLLTTASLEAIMESDWLGGLQLEGDERKNLVPVEWVSAAMTWIITHPELHGATYHLTNPSPATVEMMLESIGEAITQVLIARQGAAGKMPSGEMIESFREQMKVYQSYWSDDPEFDSTRTETALPHLPCPAVDRAVMDRLIQFAIDANFGWPREAPIKPRYDLDKQLSRWLAAGRGLPSGNGDRRYVSLRVSGSGGGQWHLVVDHGELVAAGTGLQNGAGPTCYLTSDTFHRLAEGQLSWERAIDTGRLVVAGASLPPSQIAQLFRELVAN